MKIYLMFMLLSFLPLLFQLCHSSTIVVDGVSEWKNPTVHIGDSIIFKHRYHYNLFIFQNQRAFNLCNFTHATLLNKPNSTTYKWHPSRLGTYFFSFSNGSISSCKGSQKLAIKVSASPPPENSNLSPELPPKPAPAPVSGGVVSSSPAYPWPFHPHQEAPPPSASSPLTVPSLLPAKGGGLPFINSNPAVPLPTGEVDSATIRPLPTSNNSPDNTNQVMMSFLALQLALVSGFFLLL